MGIEKSKRKKCASLLIMIIVCALVLPLFVPTVNAAAVPTEKEIVKQISNTYDRALKWWGRDSFAGWCGHYVNLQLLFRGINTSYVGGNGNTEFDNYKDMTVTSGDRIVHAYPASNDEFAYTLQKIASQANVVTDILVGFEWTSTAAGQKYGHVFFIHAIIDGYVYFSDNYTVEIAGVKYNGGDTIKCTIDELVKYYGDKSKYRLEGIVWFEDTELMSEQGATFKSDLLYRVNSDVGLRLRSGPSVLYKALDRMPNGTQITVLDIVNGWGRVFYNGVEGWCSLDYCDWIQSTEDNEPLSIAYRVNSSIGLKLRSGPGTSYSKLLVIPDKAEITVLEISANGWGRIIYDNIEGWCSLDYCVLVEGLGASDQSSLVYTINYSAGLRLRSGPSTQHKTLLTIPCNTELEILEISETGWGRIIYNNIEGWCSLDYGTLSGDKAENQYPLYQVVSSIGLRLRSGPSTEHDTLLWLPDSLEIQVLEVSPNGWGKIVYNGVYGWCSLDYCSKLG